jgi:hypothetical protein
MVDEERHCFRIDFSIPQRTPEAATSKPYTLYDAVPSHQPFPLLLSATRFRDSNLQALSLDGQALSPPKAQPIVAQPPTSHPACSIQQIGKGFSPLNVPNRLDVQEVEAG